MCGIFVHENNYNRILMKKPVLIYESSHMNWNPRTMSDVCNYHNRLLFCIKLFDDTVFMIYLTKSM